MPISSSDTWRKNPREDPRPSNSKRQRHPLSGGDDDDEHHEEANHHNSNSNSNAVYSEEDDDEDLHPNPRKNPNPNPNSRTRPTGLGPTGDEVVKITEFPMVVMRKVKRPLPAVIVGWGREKENGVVLLENLSHGQLQVLSAVPAENVALAMGVGDQEGSGLYIVTPPSIMEGRGVVKMFWNGRVHVLPLHADWFCPTIVHRLERQAVPRFFCGKSADHTPEKYMDCRNLIVAKYMEHPEKRLLANDFHGMSTGVDLEDMTRIFWFLEHWGIINYCAPVPDHEPLNMESVLREDASGEVHVPSDALKSIESLIKFDRPKCRLKAEDAYSSLKSKSDDTFDLENRIREKLSENRCNSCSKPLLPVCYQSLKEADLMLCPDCYHDGRLVIGHSSMDFTKGDSAKDNVDTDVDSWSDQETLLLLEAVELYNDNWNDVAEHVGSKSKAQCILHFLRLPVEDGLLSNIDVPQSAEMPSNTIKNVSDVSYLDSSGNPSGSWLQNSDSNNALPFPNSGNPVMSLVAFLASSVGPRVAAACAHASLAALSEDDGTPPSESTLKADGLIRCDRKIKNDGRNAEVRESGHHRDENISAKSRSQNNAEGTSLSAKKVEHAAKAGVAAAALKAKLFADHEEREIQRLSANIVNHQLRRLELKLKQFAEVETLLMKECEQVEKVRLRIAAERHRNLPMRGFGSPGVPSPVNVPGASPSMVNTSTVTSNRPTQLMSPSASSQPSSSVFSQMNHPNMPFMPRQPMFPYGARPNLPTMHSSPSSQSPNAMFNPQGVGQSSVSRPVARPVPGSNSSNLG